MQKNSYSVNYSKVDRTYIRRANLIYLFLRQSQVPNRYAKVLETLSNMTGRGSLLSQTIAREVYSRDTDSGRKNVVVKPLSPKENGKWSDVFHYYSSTGRLSWRFCIATLYFLRRSNYSVRRGFPKGNDGRKTRFSSSTCSIVPNLIASLVKFRLLRPTFREDEERSGRSRDSCQLDLSHVMILWNEV